MDHRNGQFSGVECPPSFLLLRRTLSSSPPRRTYRRVRKKSRGKNLCFSVLPLSWCRKKRKNITPKTSRQKKRGNG